MDIFYTLMVEFQIENGELDLLQKTGEVFSSGGPDPKTRRLRLSGAAKS